MQSYEVAFDDEKAERVATALTLNCTAFISNDNGFQRLKHFPLRLLSDLVSK